MPSVTLTDEYDRMIETLKLNSFSGDKEDVALLTALRNIMGTGGPEVTHKQAVEDLRTRCERGGAAKFFGAKKSKESDAILKLAGDGPQKNSKAAAIKTLRHLRLLTKFGGQDVWMLSMPKSYRAWALDEFATASDDGLTAKLRDVKEYHTKKEMKDLAAATVKATAWANKAAAVCAADASGTGAVELVKRWFADEDDHGDDRIAEIRKELSKGFNLIASAALSSKLILSEAVSQRGTKLEKSEAMAASAERLNVVYIESAFFGTSNHLTGMKNWARIMVHELSHRMLKTDDVETHGKPRYSHHPRGIGPKKGSYSTAQAMKNADNWAWFAADASGELTTGERAKAVDRPGIS